MNQRQIIRQINRIPRLQFHIKRCAGQPERVAGFKEELARRKAEMKAAGQDDLLKELLSLKIGAEYDDEFKKLEKLLTKHGAEVRQRG
jgi:hypothetical protein